MQNAKLVFFDLEGPLTPMDHAFEAAGLFPSGKEIFSLLSSYVGNAVQNGDTYQASETLALLVPFLLCHGITDEQLLEVSRQATLVSGSEMVMNRLIQDGASPYIISTSYEHHAKTVGARLGVPEESILSTPLILSALSLNRYDEQFIRWAEAQIIELKDDPVKLRPYFDKLFLQNLPESGYGNPLKRVLVLGGKRKAEAVRKISEEIGVPLSRTIVVGDSITDAEMLKAVKEAGGLAVAFNANEHALREANVALASPDMRYLLSLIYNFWPVGLEGARRFIQRRGKISAPRKEGSPIAELSGMGNFHFLEEGVDLDPITKIHAEARRLVRGKVGKLN